jgi:ubiquinone/menaquinone biosynthesis C-methylase UbiE
MTIPLPRTPEPELMNEAEQARAYAEADFAEPHEQFIARFAACFPALILDGTVLDLGCGPADVSVRFAKAYPRCHLHGIDGAPAMLERGQARIEAERLTHRIRLIEGYLPGADLPCAAYAAVISNSLLHHLRDPQVLWEAVRRYGRPGAAVFVMDLRRPQTLEEADVLVRRHAAGEPAILQRDFRHSLHAAYRPEEVRQQLQMAGLADMEVQVISDRHLAVAGWLPLRES